MAQKYYTQAFPAQNQECLLEGMKRILCAQTVSQPNHHPQLSEIADAGTAGNFTYVVNTMSENAILSALSLVEIKSLSAIYDGIVTVADLSELTAALGIDSTLTNGREQIYAIFGNLL